MGCDIHFYVEKWNGQRWESADKWTDGYERGQPGVDYDDRYFVDRNYRLFSILADVRNEDGEERIVPIAAPRGLPADVSFAVHTVSEAYGVDGHSHSHATLQELLDYDWTQVATLRGLVNGDDYAAWERYGRKGGESPRSWCRAVGGGSTRTVSEDQMRDFIANGDKHGQMDLSRVYTQVAWTQPYYKLASNFLSKVIFRMVRLGKPEHVRCVFWFDN